MLKTGLWVILAATLLLGQAALAQDDVKPEDYKKLYEDTRVQLKAAQDRKSELADENAKLTAQVTELKKSQAAAEAQITDMKLQIAAFSERTLFLRTHYTAWLQFISDHPMVQMQWDLFLSTLSPMNATMQLQLIDPNWPLGDK